MKDAPVRTLVLFFRGPFGAISRMCMTTVSLAGDGGAATPRFTDSCSLPCTFPNTLSICCKPRHVFVRPFQTLCLTRPTLASGEVFHKSCFQRGSDARRCCLSLGRVVSDERKDFVNPGVRGSRSRFHAGGDRRALSGAKEHRAVRAFRRYTHLRRQARTGRQPSLGE